jgi:formylglycine-generating enzyme required for sulfatase activity
MEDVIMQKLLSIVVVVTCLVLPVAADNIRLDLLMPGTMFGPGSPFSLDLSIENTGQEIAAASLFVALTVGSGDFWFYPSWAQYPPIIDREEITVPADFKDQWVIIAEFAWPYSAGAFDEAMFLAAVLHNDPSHDYGPTMNHPVHRISWFDAVLYANLLSVQNGYTPCCYKDAAFTVPVDATNYDIDNDIYCNFDADGYRLPTEAEWEYAARAGTTGPFSSDEPNYNSETCTGCFPNPPLEVLDSIAWWCGNANNKAHSVATKLPNPWGLYDMHGNVEEMCWDRFAMPYPSDDVTDPVGPSSGFSRVVRGGSWRRSAISCRSASRSTVYIMNGGTERFRGFRLVQTVTQ